MSAHRQLEDILLYIHWTLAAPRRPMTIDGLVYCQLARVQLETVLEKMCPLQVRKCHIWVQEGLDYPEETKWKI